MDTLHAIQHHHNYARKNGNEQAYIESFSCRRVRFVNHFVQFKTPIVLVAAGFGWFVQGKIIYNMMVWYAMILELFQQKNLTIHHFSTIYVNYLPGNERWIIAG